MPQQAGATPLFLVLLGALCVVSLVIGLGVVAFIVIRLRRSPPGPPPPELDIDLRSLPQRGPPESGPVVECYGVPMRLAVLVMAPLGRGEFPPDEQLLDVLDNIVPGLGDVLATHETMVRRWPPQFSPRGFAHFFQAKCPLPGERGKSTPWCSVAGKLDLGSTNMMVGLALCAASNNGLSYMQVERDEQWLEILRVVRRP